jgi:hypothetical protein
MFIIYWEWADGYEWLITVNDVGQILVNQECNNCQWIVPGTMMP